MFTQHRLQGKLRGFSAEELGQYIKRLSEKSPGVKILKLVRLERLLKLMGGTYLTLAVVVVSSLRLTVVNCDFFAE